MMSLDPAQLAALAAVVREGTFDAAARALHVTPSAISQRIKALENASGRVVVTRTKPVTPTAAGAALVRLARQVELLTASTLDEIGSGPQGGTVVSVAVNADSLATWFPLAIGAPADGPPIVLDVRRADQDTTADLLRDGTVMAAVTSAADAVPGCSVTRLGRMVYRAVATPAFVRRWLPDGPTADALARAPLVAYDRTDGLQDTYLRRRSRRPLDPPRHHVPDSWAFVRSVDLGLGWGMIPDQQRAGTTLVELDARGSVAVTLYWQQWRLRSPVLDGVAEQVRTAAHQALSALS
jgi:LysR family transcriptional regulator (chromosome initiation inhibitor)